MVILITLREPKSIAMELVQSQPKKVIGFSSHPYYFAHYLNMARHNAYLILSDISSELKVTAKIICEENLAEIELLNDTKFGKRRPDEIARRNQLLIKHFPFLREEEQPEKNSSPYGRLTEKIKEALTTLHQLRNCFSHYPFDESAYTAFDPDSYFISAITRAEKRMSSFFSPDDFSLLKNDGQGIYQLNTDNRFTLKGICFFTCFFLEKKYAFQFLGGIQGFKDRREKKYRATLEVFTEHCCRLPYPKLESSDFKLDMVNELSRCPDALFKVLGKEDQKLFIVESEDQSLSEGEQQEAVMKRYEDRFPYFALRYFDESKILGDIHFHVHIGRWIKGKHNKIMIVDRERRILKDIRTFGELKDFSAELIPDFWSDAGVSIDDFDPFAPCYRIVGNRIGISVGTKPVNWPMPGITGNIRPTAILSTYELPNLFVYAYLHRQGKIDLSPADFIRNYITRLAEFIKAVQNRKVTPVGDFSLERKRYQGDDKILLERKAKLQNKLDDLELKSNDLPDSIRDYLLGYKWKNEKKQAKDFIKKMVHNTDRAIERSGKVKAGEMAQFLTRDIVFLSPPFERDGHPQKLNEKEYDILQKAIAYFSSNKQDITDFLKQHGLLTGKQKHPFLNRVNLSSCAGIFDFYKAYLSQKRTWLEHLYESFGYKSFDAGQFFEKYGYFVKMNKKKALAKNYSDTPPCLPRGIFNKAIIESLKKDGYAISEGDNVAFALKLLLNQASQPFYSKPRYYNSGDKQIVQLPEHLQPKDLVSGIKNFLKDLPDDSDEVRQLRYRIKDICQSEKEIRYSQTTDRALWLMISELFPSNVNLGQDGLNHVGFDLEGENILTMLYPMEENLYEYKIQDQLPIRHYGEFRRFLKDRRLENLLKYFDKSVPVKREQLVKELEAYDLKRKDLLKKIYEFEVKVYRRYGDKLKYEEKNGHQYIPHWKYLDLIKQEYKIELPFQHADDFKFADLRNKLLHNEILYNEEIANRLKQQDNEEGIVTLRIFNLIGDTYDNMLTLMEKENRQ